MPKYKKVDVSEPQLEDLIRQDADLIEEGLVFVDHQKQAAGGRLDVLFVAPFRAKTTLAPLFNLSHLR